MYEEIPARDGIRHAQKRVCTRVTPTGRITLNEMRLIVTKHGERHERQLSEAEWQRALAEHFGIDPAELAPA